MGQYCGVYCLCWKIWLGNYEHWLEFDWNSHIWLLLKQRQRKQQTKLSCCEHLDPFFFSFLFLSFFFFVNIKAFSTIQVTFWVLDKLTRRVQVVLRPAEVSGLNHSSRDTIYKALYITKVYAFFFPLLLWILIKHFWWVIGLMLNRQDHISWGTWAFMCNQ